jgi:hypothetical protein
MNFFSRSKDNARPIDAVKQQRVEHKVSMTGKDYSDMQKCSVTLKVWLPESVEKQLGELTSYLNTSLSDLIRQILFQHLYGRYDLIGLVERQKFDPEKPDDPYSGVRFSIGAAAPSNDSFRSLRPIAEPPRKIAGVKVFIPERMRKDLDAMAGKKFQTISEYVRLVILNHLFGTLHSSGIQTTAPGNVEEGIE